MFLDDEFIVAPIKVSDLFLYANSRRAFSEIFLYIKLICDKKVMFEKVLNMTDHVFNYYDGYYLHPYQRYLVKAKHVTSNEVEQVKTDRSKERHKHILIVTGILLSFHYTTIVKKTHSKHLLKRSGGIVYTKSTENI